MVERYCVLPELKKFMETMIVEANLKMIGQTRVGSYLAHSVVEKVSGTTKYNEEDSYLYVILHPVDYQAVWVFNMDKLDDLHEEQWFKSPSCALSRKLNFCISDACNSVYQTSFSFSDMLWDLVDHPSTLRHCNDGLILLVWVEKPPPLPPEFERGYRGCSGQTSMISNHALYARPPAKPPHDSSKLLLLKEQTLTKKVDTNVVMRVIELDKCIRVGWWKANMIRQLNEMDDDTKLVWGFDKALSHLAGIILSFNQGEQDTDGDELTSRTDPSDSIPSSQDRPSIHPETYDAYVVDNMRRTPTAKSY
ncbi:hypothetical protein QQ045_018702 [Rhodiola kirilowii]